MSIVLSQLLHSYPAMSGQAGNFFNVNLLERGLPISNNQFNARLKSI